MKEGLQEAVEGALGEPIASLAPVAGGDINQAFRVETNDGAAFFLKARAGSDRAEFEDEAAGLDWLAAAGGLSCPRPVCVIEGADGAGLLLEWVEPGAVTDWEAFGHGLATVHMADGGEHGVRPPGSDPGGVRFGELRLPPVAPGSGLGFTEVYGERITFLVREARERDVLDRQAADRLLDLADRVPALVGDDQRPARLHGDLWSGNVLPGADGKPWLIDPAAYGGDAEVDLAMLELFGSPPEAFYRAYDEVRPLREGIAERRTLWQIQPLLVHAVLFGGHYGRAADEAARSLV